MTKINNKKNDTIRYHNKYSTKSKSLDLRLGYGKNKSNFVEIGVTRNTFITSCTGWVGDGYYGSLEFIPSQWSSFSNNIYAAKMGLEFSAFIVGLAAELKYQTDFHQNDVVSSPKNRV